jgi:endonuclease YncB( thermonuclease family)
MRVLLLLCALLHLGAVDITCRVVRIADGDTLIVQATDGLPPAAKRGKGGDVYIRLLCVDTLEIWDDTAPKAPEGLLARDLLAKLAPPGATIVLSDDARELGTDRYGRVLAFARVGAVSVQERLVAQGLSAYWRKWRDAPQPLHDALLQAEAGARADHLGAWKTQPDLMARKAAERPK